MHTLLYYTRGLHKRRAVAKQEIIAKRIIGHKCKATECAFEIDVVVFNREKRLVEVAEDVTNKTYGAFCDWVDEHLGFNWVVSQNILK